MLLAAGHSANFVLFCAANRTVREEAVKALCTCKNLYWADWSMNKNAGLAE